MMLQRAASNAYSWWWASHIRTKQSKWLEQNLQGMEEKVANTLKLIEEDGDSFAKRAEMYYKKRPELINFVEESYRAYRALAERYDHISTELQNANNTIASVFPDQVPFEMDEDDEDILRRPPENSSKPNIPKVPKAPLKDLKSILSSGAKKLRPWKAQKVEKAQPAVSKSGLTKPEAMEKIDKLQKDILALQTVKEFVKSSYEGGLARYWEIEAQIAELQEEASTLQDEFGEGIVIEDDEARSVMAAAALKSCQETLADLREKQRRSVEEAKTEQKKIKDAWLKFESLRKEISPDHQPAGDSRSGDVAVSFEEFEDAKEGEELKALEEKIKEHFQAGVKATLTVTEMAEKIDELVNKVISLETAVSSQSALIERLRREADGLQSQIQSLEDDKANLINGSEKTVTKMKEVEEKLLGVKDLNASVKAQNINLQTHFTEADCNLEHLSDKVQFVKPDDEQEVASLPKEAEEAPLQQKSKNSVQEPAEIVDLRVSDPKQKKEMAAEQREAPTTAPPDSIKAVDVKTQESKDAIGSEEKKSPSPSNPKNEENDSSEKSTEPPSQNRADNSSRSVARKQSVDLEEPNWQEMFMKGMENREKTLLSEYTATLRNYKEVKRKLVEVEKKNLQDAPASSGDTDEQVRELKSANASKDEEIRTLREKLSLLQSLVSEGKDSKEKNLSISQNERDMGIEAMMLVDHGRPTSEIEEKLRMDIDQLLEENLDFWMRFSAALHQIQKYETAVEDLRAELLKLDEKRKEEGSKSRAFSIKSDVKPIYKHLSEIQTELNVWMEKCVLLKDEQQKRLSSLWNIQEEITKALKTSAEDEDFRFTSYQAAKFQGEVLNMKQENNKVAEELQAGLDHIAVLQLEVEKTLARLNEDFGLAPPTTQNPQIKHSVSRNRVPLRSFIFGTKPKKHRSIFTCMTPAMHRKYNGFRAAF